jgi:hypothetical protein
VDFTKTFSSPSVEPSKKLNLLALNQLKYRMSIAADEKPLERKILRSLLTNLENIITVPQKFNKKIIFPRKIGLGKDGNVNKLLCLRRWNSYTPVIPRPIDFSRGSGGTHAYNSNKCPGGGYFLIWNNKGIVIDPGFDFIRNLYSAGYSIADIDAIFLTHAHIDHMSDFFSLLTLLYERKDLLQQLYGEGNSKFKRIDLFLNIGCMNSFLPWFSSQTKDTIRNIWALPRSANVNDSENARIVFDEGEYNFTIEITKAAHKEIFTADWAVGLKFYLPTRAHKEPIVLGITGDTKSDDRIIGQYSDCDIIAGHLGDINFKELALFAGISIGEEDAKYIVKPGVTGGNIEYLKELAVSLGVDDTDLPTIDDANVVVRRILRTDPEYQLKNHLGFKGIHKLAISQINNCRPYQKIFIFTEFPEYFGSFRKRIAAHFNSHLCPGKKVFFTGDLALQVLIDEKSTDPDRMFLIQCNKCARDNDLPLTASYHKADQIQETCVKSNDESIVYYCENHKVDPMWQFINRISQ